MLWTEGLKQRLICIYFFFQNGINSGPVNMSLDTKEIIKRTMDRLHNYLRSHYSMLLTNSFKINIKVLSREHMAHRSLTAAVGNNSDHKGVLKTPLGYTSQEEAFSGQCCILSTLLAMELNSIRMGNISKFCNKNSEAFLKDINEFNVLTDKFAGEKLQQEIERFFSMATSPKKEDGYELSSIMPHLSTFYNIQIHLFSSQGQSIKESSFPLKFDPTKEQVYLHHIRIGDKFHLEVINDFGAFQREVKKYYCFYCDTSVKSPPNRYRHTCFNGKYCLCCKRKILTDTTWCLPKDKKNYCDSRAGEEFGECPKCNLTFKSLDCKKSHRVTECSRTFKCKECKMVVYAGAGRNGTAMSELHDCNEKQCKECKLYFIGTHVCKLKESKVQKDWGKLSFLVFSYLKHQLNSNEFEQVPVQACFVHEDTDPGHFKVTMYHGTEQQTDVRDTKKEFVRRFWPSDIVRTLNNNGKIVQFGQYERGIQLKGESEPNVVGTLIKNLISDKNYMNSTVITQSCDDLKAIVATLISQNIRPEILRKDGNILKVSLSECNIRFININNFQGPVSQKFLFDYKDLTPDTTDIIDDCFFPHNLTTDCSDSILDSLEFDYFFQSSDDNNIISAKRDYVIRQTNSNIPYILKNQGLRYLYRVTLGLAYFSLDYVTESFDFQLEAKLFLDLADIQTKLLNPLAPPFVSNGAFIFSVFRMLDLNKRDIKAIPREHVGLTKNNVSKGECQWVYFLCEIKKKILEHIITMLMDRKK